MQDIRKALQKATEVHERIAQLSTGSEIWFAEWKDSGFGHSVQKEMPASFAERLSRYRTRCCGTDEFGTG